jgi:hypothetical protein
MPEQIWDFSPPQIQGISWRSSHVTVVARTRRDFQELKSRVMEQGETFNEAKDGTYFTFKRPVPGTHNGSMSVMVLAPTPAQEDSHMYDNWVPGEGYAGRT